ncbi:hypothetical protein NA57DRAFT_66901 [Rhizodiscina lignyota]|uniref:Transmembrane protein 135 N-terminal domain-containing protein n=1 Tax=Rhizodiscina lignyota TaxID=1504668 RepID=A0A9P4IC49_9PEZI|nr:hypothetical protein NA57DRAFT_66901 [Rhizodiscina lignyota]
MSSVSSSSSSGSGGIRPENVDPVVRTALRYTLSEREYRLLHQYLLSRAPAVRRRTPAPPKYAAIVKSKDDYNAAAIRASFRVFASTYAALKLWDTIKTKILSRGAPQPSKTRTSILKSGAFRLSSSLALILLFHRLLHRFFTRLRESLLTDNARPFRRRNPRVARTLTSRLTPAIGASLAGFFLAISPADQLRITLAIYFFSRSLEFIYNALEDKGYFSNRPWWFGSWMLVPPAFGQLLHAFVFDRDCFPKDFGGFIMKNSGPYLQAKPTDYPGNLEWPGTYEIVDSLAEISRSKWPAFVSPILFPAAETLPRSLSAISPITSPAHPSIKSLSCALLHPSDPSCLRTYITYYIQVFPNIARFFAIIFSAASVPRYKTFLSDPVASINRLSKAILRMSLFVTGAIGTSWGSICFFQQYLPKGFLATQRWFLGGFLGGLWAFLERKSGRANFFYMARLSIDSFWKVGVKHGWWRGIKNGDVLLFVVSLAIINGIYEKRPRAVNGPSIRKSLGMLRGDGWVDRVVVIKPKSEKEEQDLAERDIKDEGTDLEKEELAEAKKEQ